MRFSFYRTRSSVAADVFDQLVALLSEAGAKFRVIEHQAEGRSEVISVIRGNRPDQAAKAMVLDLRGGGGGKRHVLAVLPGNRKLDFNAVARLFDARKCGFASPDTAQTLTGCVMGSVPPFSLNTDLAIVVDEDLLANGTLFFNAGRLDRSMELDTSDWLAIVRPRLGRIAAKA
jgi:Ala-tRNA(Pro) deacylase